MHGQYSLKYSQQTHEGELWGERELWDISWEFKNWSMFYFNTDLHFDGLVQYCSISIALAMEILQSCIKPPI